MGVHLAQHFVSECQYSCIILFEWLFFPDIGVAQAMREKWGDKFHENIMFCGGSAGTVTAVMLSLGKTHEDLAIMYKYCARKTNSRGFYYRPSEFLTECIEKIVRESSDTYKILQGKCCFGTTAFFSHHRWHMNWADNDDLLKSIIGSYNIPVYCSKSDAIYGFEVVDGAYGVAGTDFPHGNETLFVGIDPLAEIGRSLTYHQMLIPSEGQEYEDLVASGYSAFMNWDGQMKDKVGQRIPNYPALCLLWALKFIEILLYALTSFFASMYALLVYCFDRNKRSILHYDSNKKD